VEVVCTGKLEDYRDPGYISRLNDLLDAGDLHSHVRILGLIPRDVQIALFRRALAVIQPSLFEGWSTVVEDARVLGKASLLSDIPVHREQNPPDCCFFSPHSAEALADLIAEKWATLEPGPDLEREAAARQTAQERIRRVGQRFLEIAAP
jgi:glycosyltransferase involved in cell wall biosynthesis